jgi:nucleoside-diphosphate-sugar epimerase
MQPSILLAGSTGFIGSNLLIHLKRKNIKVYDLLRSYKKKKIRKSKNYYPIFFKNNSELESKLKKVKINTVINCATHYSLNEDSNSLINLINANVIFGTLIIKNTCSKVKKFINFGSMMEYEGNKQNPNNIYAITKVFYEKILNYFKKKNKAIKIYNIKIFETFGDNDNRAKIIPTIINNYKNNKNFKLVSSKIKMNFVDINNVIKFIDQILYEKINPGSYCLRNRKFININKTLYIINKKLKKKIKIKILNKKIKNQTNQKIPGLKNIISKNDINKFIIKKLI